MKKFNYGIWLDHKKAYIIKQGNDLDEIKEIVNMTEGLVREPGLNGDSTNWGYPGGSSNEYRKNNILRNELKDYFNRICKELGLCDELLLFGPTKAKNEFFTFLIDKKILKDSKIFIKTTDKLSENEMLRLVEDFYVNTRSLKV